MPPFTIKLKAPRPQRRVTSLLRPPRGVPCASGAGEMDEDASADADARMNPCKSLYAPVIVIHHIPPVTATAPAVIRGAIVVTAPFMVTPNDVDITTTIAAGIHRRAVTSLPPSVAPNTDVATATEIAATAMGTTIGHPASATVTTPSIGIVLPDGIDITAIVITTVPRHVHSRFMRGGLPL
jgi:hypothetical protein